jgi:predicted AAA+ superfamily ATPase
LIINNDIRVPIVLAGPNGVGKTTLLEILRDELIKSNYAVVFSDIVRTMEYYEDFLPQNPVYFHYCSLLRSAIKSEDQQYDSLKKLLTHHAHEIPTPLINENLLNTIPNKIRNDGKIVLIFANTVNQYLLNLEKSSKVINGLRALISWSVNEVTSIKSKIFMIFEIDSDIIDLPIRVKSRIDTAATFVRLNAYNAKEFIKFNKEYKKILLEGNYADDQLFTFTDLQE